MKINTDMRFIEQYLPTPRHRKLREREVSEPFSIDIREATSTEAPVVLRTHDIKRYCDGIVPTDYRQYDGELYTPVRLCDMRVPDNDAEANLPYPPERLTEDFARTARVFIPSYPSAESQSRDAAIKNLNEYSKRFLLIDGAVWERAGEPMYKVCTFGLGHNHGGTALMITNHFNSNCRWEDYYSALEHDKAVEAAAKTAAARGDTESVPRIESKRHYIEVLDPSAVRADPKAWGGKGNDFLNMLDGITRSSDSAMEAGVMAIAATGMEMDKKPSLDAQIHSASSRASSNQSPETKSKDMSL